MKKKLLPGLHNRLFLQFRSLTLGYQNTTGSATILAFWDVLRTREIPLYPGEGDRIVSILAEIEHYQYNIDDLDDLYNSAEALTRIMSRILDDEHSILTQQVFRRRCVLKSIDTSMFSCNRMSNWLQKQLLLQQLTQRNLEYWVRQLIYPYKHLVLSSVVVDIQALHAHDSDSTKHSLQIPVDDYMWVYVYFYWVQSCGTCWFICRFVKKLVILIGTPIKSLYACTERRSIWMPTKQWAVSLSLTKI